MPRFSGMRQRSRTCVVSSYANVVDQWDLTTKSFLVFDMQQIRLRVPNETRTNLLVHIYIVLPAIILRLQATSGYCLILPW
jgi:hypothetical protein